MVFDSGLREFEKKNSVPIIPTGNETLNKLLLGGFHLDLLYLLYGDKRITTDILLKTAVNAQMTLNKKDILDNSVQIAYVDGINRFSPYKIAKYAVSLRLNPRTVLENILISRVFTWDQMVEVLENRIVDLDMINVVLISGITSLFKYEKEGYEDLWKAISGIKRLLSKSNPLILITAPQNKFSEFKPEGGHIITHFGNVLVMIENKERKVEYKLIQHPSMPEITLTKVKPYESQKRKPKPYRNKTLDKWIRLN